MTINVPLETEGMMVVEARNLRKSSIYVGGEDNAHGVEFS